MVPVEERVMVGEEGDIVKGKLRRIAIFNNHLTKEEWGSGEERGLVGAGRGETVSGSRGTELGIEGRVGSRSTKNGELDKGIIHRTIKREIHFDTGGFRWDNLSSIGLSGRNNSCQFKRFSGDTGESNIQYTSGDIISSGECIG